MVEALCYTSLLPMNLEKVKRGKLLAIAKLNQ